MAKVTITNPTPHKGRVIHGIDGRAHRRCRICGGTVYGRNGGICRYCLSKRLDNNGTIKGVAHVG